jgi:hypothetical protein
MQTDSTSPGISKERVINPSVITSGSGEKDESYQAQTLTRLSLLSLESVFVPQEAY